MKRIFLLSTIVCLVTVDRVYSENNTANIIACAKELNLDAEKYKNGVKLEEFLANPNDDDMCMLACSLRKSSNERGLTLYKGFLNTIDEAYKDNFKSTNFTREDAVSQIEHCFTNEQGECAFFKCAFHPPFADIFAYNIIGSVINAVIKAVFSLN